MKSNAIRLYKHFCEMVENPKGADSQERILVRSLAMKAKKNMEQRFKKARKYQNDSDILKILGEKPKEKIKEAKEDGKKSKR